MVTGCGKSVPALTQPRTEATPHILAQMGPEPILNAMLANPDFNVLIAGRAYDPAPYIAFAAFASKCSFDSTRRSSFNRLWGDFVHMGQCGRFDVTPLDPSSKCTPISVAAHTLYEKSRPDILYGPGGYLNLNKMNTEALEDGRSVWVSGGIYQFLRDERKPYTIKLEGAEIVGYRAQMMGSIRDRE
jgi:hypothetical protein